jgi:hypothetical protein
VRKLLARLGDWYLYLAFKVFKLYRKLGWSSFLEMFDDDSGPDGEACHLILTYIDVHITSDGNSNVLTACKSDADVFILHLVIVLFYL